MYFFPPSKQEDNIICLQVITAYEIAEDKPTIKTQTKKTPKQNEK